MRNAILSPNEAYVLGVKWNGNVSLWRAKTGETAYIINLESSVYYVAFSPDSRYMALGLDNMAVVYDVATGAKVRTFARTKINPYDDGTNVYFTYDGKRLITSGAEGAVLWDLETGHQLHIFAGDMAIYSSGRAEISIGTKYLLTYGLDGYLVWDIDTGNLVHNFLSRADEYASLSPDDSLLVTDVDFSFNVWNTKTFKRKYTFENYEQLEHVWAFSPNSRYLIAWSTANEIMLWDTASGRLIHTFPKAFNIPTPFAFSSTSELVYLPGSDQSRDDDGPYNVTVWNIRKNREEKQLQIDQWIQGNVSIITKDGRYWLVDDGIGRLSLRDANTGDQIIRYC